MSPLAFFEQLADTPSSVSIHESEIAYSLIESIHVWSMCLFFGLTVMFDLRLLGWTMRKVPVSEFANRLVALDHCGVRRHGHQRHAAFLRDTGQVLSEYLLQVQNGVAAVGRFERVDVSLTRLFQGRRVGFQRDTAAAGLGRRRVFPGAMDRRHRFGKNDRL